MPRLSDSMEEGTILAVAEVGRATRSRVGEELVEIETDKANMVYEGPTVVETDPGGRDAAVGEPIGSCGGFKRGG